MDHGLDHVETLLVGAHEAAPARQPAEDLLDHPASGQRLEAELIHGSANALKNEVAIGSGAASSRGPRSARCTAAKSVGSEGEVAECGVLLAACDGAPSSEINSTAERSHI